MKAPPEDGEREQRDRVEAGLGRPDLLGLECDLGQQQRIDAARLEPMHRLGRELQSILVRRESLAGGHSVRRLPI
jgi:hypothetical protein